MKQTNHNKLFSRVLWLLAAILPAFAFGPALRTTSAKGESITLTSPGAITITESDDYATQVLGDPWDMNNIEDLDWPHDLTDIAVENGIWRGTTTTPSGGSVQPQYQNFENGYSYVGEKDGVNYPIDSHRFSRLWVRMYSDVQSQTLLWFYPHYGYIPDGNSNFIEVRPGWNIYNVDLRLGGMGGTGNWTQEGPYEGLRFDMPWFAAGNHVQIDWMRLTPDSGQMIPISWSHTGEASTPVRIFLSLSPDPTARNEYEVATVPAGQGRYEWNATGLAPGTYYLHAQMNDAWSTSGPLVVEEVPMVRVDAPSPLSGEDYAQARLAAGWESCSQFVRMVSINSPQCNPGTMIGFPGNNDPYAYWLLGNYAGAIDTGRYRYANVRFLVAPPVARPFSPFNAGTRIVWDSGGPDRTSHMILAAYNRWIQASFDMDNVPVVEGGRGWSGNVSTIRFDPMEEDDAYGQPPALPEYFMIDRSHITADPVSGAGTIVRWTPLQGSGVVDIYRDNNNSGFDGTLVASNIPMSQGSHSWDTSGLPNGTYWVYLVARDASNQSRTYSLAPLIVNHSLPSTLFSDVPPNHWAVDDINRLALLGVVSGSAQPDTTVNFRPANTAFRSHLSKMVTLAAGWPLVNPGTPTFVDVPRDNTFYQYIETAAVHGVIAGYQCGGPGEPCPGRYFRPNANVTRAQTAKMIAVSRGWALVNPGNNTFADVPVGDSLFTYVETAYAHNIISGYPCGGPGEPCDGQSRPYFRPGNNVTRAQLSKMLARALDSD